MGMTDDRTIGTRYANPRSHQFRFAGVTTANTAPAAVANNPDSSVATLVRNSTGNFTLTPGINVGYVQSYWGDVATNLAVRKTCLTQPPAANVWPITFTMQVVYSGNYVNVDINAGEELLFAIEVSGGKP